MRKAIGTSLLLLATGCSYIEKRALDFTDIVDVRYGLSAGLAGAKIEVTDYAAAGAGLGILLWEQEWFGRWVVQKPGLTFFLMAGIVGASDIPMDNARDSMTCGAVWGYQDRAIRPPVIDRFRLGGEAFGPLLHFGLYLNFGELADFFAGVIGADPACDDDMPKGVLIKRPRVWRRYSPSEPEVSPLSPREDGGGPREEPAAEPGSGSLSESAP